MTQKLMRNARPNPLRPKMALGVDTVDRDYVPHHLTRSQVESARLVVESTFSPIGKWVELRLSEYSIRANSTGRESIKSMTATYDGEALLALCEFFAAVRTALTTSPEEYNPDPDDDTAVKVLLAREEPPHA